jgi:tetratricopeptide (TPR) repeat protein
MTTAPAQDLPGVPRELVEAGAGGRLVVLVGAGASFGAGLPSWEKLLFDLLAMGLAEAAGPGQRERLEEAQREWSGLDAPLRAAVLGAVMGKDWLPEAIARRFREASPHPTATHRALAALPGAAFVTTNYDQLLEAAIQEETGRPPRRVLVSDVEGVRDFGPGHVLKLHGDVEAPRSIVVETGNVHRAGREAPRAWRERLKALLQPPYQILLVGYPYGDTDVQAVVDELRAAYEGKLRGPFWLEVESFAASVKADAGALRPIWLKDHDQVVPWLESLAKAIETERARAPVVVKAAAYAGLVHEELRKKADVAGGHFQAQRYLAAQVAYQEILGIAERLAAAAPDDEDLRQWIARSRLNVAGCSVCLQSTDARDRLREVADHDVDHLKAEWRAQLSMGLAQTGDLDRARLVLPPDDLSEEVRAARQLIEVKEGRVPDRPWASSSILRMHIAGAQADQGQLDEAARMARDLLQEEPEDVLLVIYSLVTLEKALRNSVHDEPHVVRPIPMEDRAPTVEAIERHIDVMPELPDALAGDLRRLRFSYYHLTGDDERRGLAIEALGDDWLVVQDSQSRYELDLVRADRLAREGKLDEALALIQPTEHPWHHRFDRAQILAVARQFDDALVEAADLARIWPGRAPIEHLLAELLAHGPHPEEALPHARAAFAALPGRGFRLLLGRCLLAAGQAEEAWSTLGPLQGSRNPEYLWARAIAAERLPDHLADAPSCWGEYLKVRPDDDAIRLRIARLWFQAGDPERAASTAREAIDRGEARLDAGSLYDCAQLVRAGGRFDEQARSYVRRIADLLHTRFPGDKAAEHYRFILLGALGFPDDAQSVDYAGLIAAGALQAIPIDEAVEAFQNEQRFGQAVYHAYRLGHLPFESLCTLTRTEAATYVVRFIHSIADRGPTALSAPVGLVETLLIPSLSGRRILTGELELLLLQHLGLLPALRHAAGERGRIVLFADVLDRIAQTAMTLEQDTQRVSLELEGRLLHVLTNSPGKIRTEEAPPRGPDNAWAAAQGLPIVDSRQQETTAISPRRLAEYLIDGGYLESDRGRRLLSLLPVEASSSPQIDTPPNRLCIAYGPLQVFFSAGALDALLSIDTLELVVGPQAMALVRGRWASLREVVEAADLASTVHRAVGAGIAEKWIMSLVRPRVRNLPDLRDPHESESAQRLDREPLELGLSFRQALAEDSDLLLLTADFFVASNVGSHREHLAKLAWPDNESLRSFVERMRMTPDRQIHLPALVRHLVPGPEARKKLIDLAKLGFLDALGPADLVALSRMYGSGQAKGAGLDKEVPKRILDRLEWMVRVPGHLGVSFALLRLAGLYAGAIWEACCGSDALPEAEGKAFVGAVFGRVESIDVTGAAALLEFVFNFIAGATIDHPRAAFERSGDNKMDLSAGSPAGRLWTHLAGWAGPEGRRRAAYGRGLRRLWLTLDHHFGSDGPSTVRVAPLFLTVEHGRPGSFRDPEVEALAILSALWKERPLGLMKSLLGEENSEASYDITLEEVLDAGVRALVNPGDGRIVLFNEAELRYLFNPNPSALNAIAQAEVPPEALLLRAPDEIARRLAMQLAALQGLQDGRAYVLLLKLSKSPEDKEARRAYARMSVLAPWRLVREDPTVICSWHRQRAHDELDFPRRIADLREMLSEPASGLASDMSLRDILATRISEGSTWAGRYDQIELGSQACEVPGFLPAVMLSTRFAQEKAEYARKVGAVLDRLDHPDEHPAARLAGDIFFLRVAAERRPHVTLPEGEIDLRERLPERLVAVLRSVISSPPPDTLAHVEAGLLRLCGDVVQELSAPVGLPLKDWLWLTYRLFQWLCAQLEAMAPDARQAGLISLRKIAPAPRLLPLEASDLLNPFRFDGERFDHRLATVLYAIATMEALPASIEEIPEQEKETPRSVTSTALEELLVQLAARPLSEEERALRSRGDRPSCLDWYGPGAVPDLALQALLGLNSGAILQMPEESRQRWILDLPRSPEDKDRLLWPLAIGLVSALTENARGLSAPEKVALEARLRSLEGPGAQRLRWIGFNNLYGAGSVHLEDEVRALLLDNLSDPVAAQAFGGYLRALSFVAPGRLQAEAERVLAAVEARSGEHGSQAGEQSAPDPVAFAWGVGAVLVTGEPGSIPAAQDLLRRLAQREPYRGSERMQQLFGILGLT